MGRWGGGGGGSIETNYCDDLVMGGEGGPKKGLNLCDGIYERPQGRQR